MSKVASYLQEHILGEVSTNPAILDAMSRDASVLEIKPEMVIYPRVTNDIRKVARFAWQLAEKGHILPLTARGYGADETGGAIGSGAILALTAHMNRILEFDMKQKLVRLQPGANARMVHDALMLHGVGIPSLPTSAFYNSIGGAIANNASGPLSGRYGDMSNWVRQLEVVLANGDLLQTGRLSKRELGKKKGLQTFEGEIYRGIDGLIEDNKQLIKDHLALGVRDNVGYSAIAKVKQKDGSFDLTPLFVGSQGTLGIISEMIMKCEFMNMHTGVAIAAFASEEVARDALDALRTLEPAFLEHFDGALFKQAAAAGKKYAIYGEGNTAAAVIAIGFDDFSEHARAKKLKKVQKLLKKVDANVVTADGDEATELLAVREVTSYAVVPAGGETSAPPILKGVYVPKERYEDFAAAVKDLATRYHVALPLHSRVLENILYAHPAFSMHKVSDKQKIFKLLDEYSSLVESFGGHLIGEDSEGRVKARFAHKQLDPEVLSLFNEVKVIFDPLGIMNPGVKQVSDMRELVSNLRSDYNTSHIAAYVPYS